MKKIKYLISVEGDTEGYSIRKLNQTEYNLIKSIFEETASEYVGCWIEEIPKVEEVIKRWHEYKEDNSIYNEWANFRDTYYDGVWSNVMSDLLEQYIVKGNEHAFDETRM